MTDALIAFSKTPRKARIPEHMEQLDAPTLVIWGEVDRIIPLEKGECMAAKLDAPLEIINDARRVPHIERPELIASLILDFLNRSP